MGPCEVVTRRLDWFQVPKQGWPTDDRAELIIASDIMYGNWGDAVARAMSLMLAPGGLILIAASEDRMTSMQHFKDEIIELGFKVLETKWKRSDGKFRLYECCKRRHWENKYTVVERQERSRSAPVNVTPLNVAATAGTKNKSGEVTNLSKLTTPIALPPV